MPLGAVDLVLELEGVEDVLSIFETLGLWMELARFRATEVFDSYGVEVRSVQAYRLHELSIVSPHRGERIAAMEHIRERIEHASALGAKRVVTVPAYGYHHARNARQICVESLRELASYASDYGVDVAVEALSSRRTSFLPSLREVVALVREIDRENVRAMGDTMHIHDAGENVAEVLAEYGGELVELHLKDSGGLPPGRGTIDFQQVLSRELNADLCLEYAGGGEDALREAAGFIRSLLR